MHYSKKRNSTTKLHLNKNELIEEIQNEEMNKECFDCGSENPEYISINNGIFLCKNCIYYHYKFPDHISTLIKNNLKMLREKELKYLYYGGNKRLSNYMYIKFPNLKQYQPDILYKSDELKFYRNKLSTIVNESEMTDNRLYLTQNNFNHPMTDKRTKSKFGLDENNNLYNNNDLKRKYNYRKIPNNKNYNLHEKYSSKTERPIKSTTRKQYKKRLIPNHSPISINKDESYQNTPNLRENRFFNESNYSSNDLNSIKRKTFERNKYNTNDKFEYGNNSGNFTYNNSILNNSSNDDKYMNFSYRGQNINYRNYIRNTINTNSPISNNFYMDFKTENNEGSSKSPQVGKDYLGGVGYNYNGKLSKYQSFYNKYNFDIPNKLVLSNQENKSLIISSNRVYSKPKLPKYKVTESKNRKIRLDSKILNDFDNNNYFTIQNINSDKIRKKLWIKSGSPKLVGKGGNSLSPDFNFDSNKNTPLRLDNIEQTNIIKENGKNKKNKDIKINYDINQNGENLVIKAERDNKNEIKGKKENGMNENGNNSGNYHEFINGNESNDNFVINGSNPQKRYISVKKKEIESNTQNKFKEEPLNQYLNNELREKLLESKNKIGNSNKIEMRENDEINSKDIINLLFSKEHNIKQVNDRNKKIKNRHKRNRKIVKREKEERLKMEKEEKIQKEIENKQKMEEEERKNQFKKKFTKNERLKMIQKERLMMEQEEIRRKREKENEDKIIKEEAEEDEQDDDENDQKHIGIEKIEERLEEEEMDLDENENEEQKIEKNNEDQKILQNNDEIINKSEEKEKLKNEQNEKEDITKTEEINIINEENKIEKEENLKSENDKIIIEGNKVKDSKVEENMINIESNSNKNKDKEKREEIIEIQNDNINKSKIKEKIASKNDKKLKENNQISNKIESKEIIDKDNQKKLFENKINKYPYNRNKGIDRKKENASNGKSTNISSNNKEIKSNKESKESQKNVQNYKTLEIDETFKNSIRNKYKRKRKLMNDSFNQSII